MNLIEHLKELLFPPKCILCGKVLEKDELDLCRDCRVNAPEHPLPKSKREFLKSWTALWYYQDNARQSILRYKFYGKRHYAIGYGRLLGMKILRDLSVTTELSKRVVSVSAADCKGRRQFRLETSDGSSYMAENVILAGGGMAGPQYGCGEEIYRIAASMGHTVRKPLPALVPLLSDDRDLKASAGVRCDAEITLICDRHAVSSERGELQMTEKGISGIPVFQLSGEAARALDRGAEVEACIDFLPGFGKQAWEEETERRLSEDKNCMLSVFFLGLVNRKILDLVFRRRGLQAEMKASRLTREGLRGIMEDLRAFRIQITGTGTFRQAQVTSGGVPLDEMDENLQSLLCPGLFMAGELLDVDGICGGYNLQWAMTSGWIAGKGAARETLK
jgi:predicted Rossmann fold flavoprotein